MSVEQPVQAQALDPGRRRVWRTVIAIVAGITVVCLAVALALLIDRQQDLSQEVESLRRDNQALKADNQALKVEIAKDVAEDRAAEAAGQVCVTALDRAGEVLGVVDEFMGPDAPAYYTQRSLDTFLDRLALAADGLYAQLEACGNAIETLDSQLSGA